MNIPNFIRNNPIRITLFIMFLAAILALRIFDVGTWIDIQTIQRYEQQLLAYVHAHYWTSVAIFISIYAIENAFALPFSFALSIAAGFIYGVAPAVIYIIIGATSGAILAFLVTRYLIGTAIQRYYHDALVQFNNELERNGAYYLITLRLIPIVPFFLINILAGLTTISLAQFTVTTATGILPGAILYAMAGYRLRAIDTLSDIFTWKTGFIFGLLVLFALAPVIIKKWYNWRPIDTQR